MSRVASEAKVHNVRKDYQPVILCVSRRGVHRPSWPYRSLDERGDQQLVYVGERLADARLPRVQALQTYVSGSSFSAGRQLDCLRSLPPAVSADQGLLKSSAHSRRHNKKKESLAKGPDLGKVPLQGCLCVFSNVNASTRFSSSRVRGAHGYHPDMIRSFLLRLLQQ